MNRPFAAATAAVSFALLAACGGGGSGTPLPITDGSPEAYTVPYLNAHPDLLVQPEHLIVARLDPNGPGNGRQSVPLHIREAMTLSLGGSNDEASVDVAIEDSAGSVAQAHHAGDAASSFTLQPGAYRLTLTPTAQLTSPRTLFLKLADTPTQAARRQQASSAPAGGLLQGSQTATPMALGSVANSCDMCSFDGAVLSNMDFSNASLSQSTFKGAVLFNTNFTNADCPACQFFNTVSPGTTTFYDANLNNASLSGNFQNVVFSGAFMSRVTLETNFIGANFGPSADRPSTLLVGADLSNALLYLANLRYADLSLARVRDDSTFYDPGLGPLPHDAFIGTHFADMTPSNLFKHVDFAGMDLTGATFDNIDMSRFDLSVGNGVKVTAAGIAQAILSNGTVGTNLSGQNFGTRFSGWAGSVDVDSSGKDLRYVNLSNTELYAADLTRANLSGAILVGANLSEANLYAAKLNGAQLGVAAATGTQRVTNLSNAYMPLADLSDADLRSADLSSVHLYSFDGATDLMLQRARLDGASFNGAILIGADFSQASMNDTDFSGAVLVNASFDGATLTNTKFNGASLQGADFGNVAATLGSDFNNAAIAATGVTLASRSPYSFTDFDGITHSYAYTNTVLGPIATSGGVTCPSGASGPCSSAAMLTAVTQPPYPDTPNCVAVRAYDYQNCLPPKPSGS